MVAGRGTARQLLQIIIEGKDNSAGTFAKLDKNAERTVKNLNKISGVALGVGTAMATGLAAAVHQTGQLEAGVADALTLVDAQGEAFEDMSTGMTDLAIGLSRDLGISAEEIASGFYNVLSTGAQALTPEFEKLTRTALVMADLVGLETAQSVEILSDTINAFKLNLADAGRVADVFFTASKQTTVTVPQLAGAFKVAAPIAANFGISLAETATVLDAFAAKGIKGVEAGTAFRIIMTRLTAGTDETKEALKELGVEIFDNQGKMRSILSIIQELQTGYQKLTQEQQANTLKVIAGEEASAKLAAVLQSDLTVLDGWLSAIQDGGGMTDAFTRKQETLTGQLRLLKAEFKAIVFEIGSELLPVVKDAIKDIRESAGEVAEWVAKNRSLVKSFAAVTLGIIGAGGALAAVTKLTTAVLLYKASVTGAQTVSLAAFGKGGAITAAILITAAAAFALYNRLQDISRELDQQASEGLDLTPDEAHDFRKQKDRLERLQRLKDQFGAEQEVALTISGEEGFINIEKAIAIVQRRLAHYRGEIIDAEDAITEMTTSAAQQIVDLARETDEAADKAGRVAKNFDNITGILEGFDPKIREEFVGPLTESEEAARNFANAIRDFNAALKEGEDERQRQKELGPEPLPELETDDQIKNMGNLEDTVTGAYTNMIGAALQFSSEGDRAFERLAQSFATTMAIMTAKLLTFAALKALLTFAGLPVPFAGGGSIGAAHGGTLSAQHGGIIRAGFGGFDNIPVLAQRNETFLDTELTDAMRDEFLGGPGRQSGGGTTVIIKANAVTATDSEALRFGRKVSKEAQGYANRFVAKGLS